MCNPLGETPKGLRVLRAFMKLRRSSHKSFCSLKGGEYYTATGLVLWIFRRDFALGLDVEIEANSKKVSEIEHLIQAQKMS